MSLHRRHRHAAPASTPSRLRRSPHRIAASLTALAFLAAAVTTHAAEASSVVATVRSLPISVGGAQVRLEYCGNGPVTTQNASVTRVVIVIHGDSRNACSAAKDIQTAALNAGHLATTLVIAPHFFASSDGTAIPAGTLYWSDGGWKSGDASLTSPYARPAAISSYAVVDKVITIVTDRTLFPNVSHVTVAGHSAGGQFTNRYAATTQLPPAATPAVARDYVVSNPSSYLYFTAERDMSGTWRPLSNAEAKNCSTYDRYKYGLQRPNAYVAADPAPARAAQYAESAVTYLVGALDTSTTDSSLDSSCSARLQGEHRRDRADTYYAYLGHTFGSAVYRNQPYVLVSDVGHTAKGIFTSPAGQQVLFP